jgi:hypothetical protein
MADLQAFTVLQPLDLPHCEEGEHEAFAKCPDCDPDLVVGARDGFVPGEIEDTFILCPTCKGTRGGGPSLGMRPCINQGGHYAPGMTVHLSEEFAQPYVDGGQLAPVESNVDELLLRAAADVQGFDLVKRA